MKRQWDTLMDWAARLAVGFDLAAPEIRPEFVLAAMFYVKRGVCDKLCECLMAEEPNLQAIYLDCLAEHYKVSLPDALRRMESGRVPQVKLSSAMKRIVKCAEDYWGENHETRPPPVDYLLLEVLASDEGLPVLELCLMEADCEREMLQTYLLGCSRYFGNTFGSYGVSVKTYSSFDDMRADIEKDSRKEKARPKVKTQTTDSIGEIEKRLHAGLIGQNHAIEAVVRALKKDAAGLKEEHKPVGVFLFAGPTGVGKTELARLLAGATGREFRRFDMSEYAEKHEAARLYGSPPGYVGYDEGGQLTNFVAKNPRGIVLFDEADKAHPDVLDALLQIAEEGSLTDGRGKVVNFCETIVIVTTNAGSRDAARRSVGFGVSGSGVSAANYWAAAYKKAIEDFFRSELRGRMTEVVVFNDLGDGEILTIAGLELDKLSARIRKSREIRLEMADGVAEAVAGQSHVATYGARNIKATIDKLISEPLADFILEHNATVGTVVRVLWLDGCGISMKVNLLEPGTYISKIRKG